LKWRIVTEIFVVRERYYMSDWEKTTNNYIVIEKVA
jgi:hypothetical protein